MCLRIVCRFFITLPKQLTILFVDKIDRDDEKISSRARAICRNIMIAAKENAANIWAVEMRSESGESGGYNGSVLQGGLHGGNGKRLADAGLSDFDRVCSSCSSKRRCYVVFYISVMFR